MHTPSPLPLHLTARPRRTRTGLALVVASTLIFAACGDDDEGQAADAYCRAHLDATAAAVAAELDPDVDVVTAFTAWVESAPDEIRTEVETATARFAAGDVDSAEFEAAYAAAVAFTAEHCGFGEVAVTATEYAFAGIPDEVDAGPTVVSFQNGGEEVHHVVLIRVGDGVTDSIEELLELPDEELFTKVSILGETFALPGEDGAEVFDLLPGRHVAICFIPTGTTPGGPPPGEGGEPGPPHLVHGMLREFSVA